MLYTGHHQSLQGKCRSVSARVSPVELLGCIPSGTHDCSYGELPLRQPFARRQQEVLPFQAGTFCLSARGLSPVIVKSNALLHIDNASPKWPFALRPTWSAAVVTPAKFLRILPQSSRLYVPHGRSRQRVPCGMSLRQFEGARARRNRQLRNRRRGAL